MDEADIAYVPSPEERARDLLEAKEVKKRLRATSKRRHLRGTIESLFGHESRDLSNNDGGIIDIMVVWTTDAECKRSGLPSGCKTTAMTESVISGLIDLAVQETNTAFARSGVLITLRLVRLFRLDGYEEKGYADMLTELRKVSDGRIDEVHAERKRYGADLVSMIGKQ